MPVAIPVIAAFASGAVGAVVAGTATFAAYASVAGAVLSVAGAVTHNKDLSRIGAIVGIVGGVASFANGASTAAEGASEAANQSAAETARLNGMEATANAAESAAQSNPIAPQAPSQVADLATTTASPTDVTPPATPGSPAPTTTDLSLASQAPQTTPAPSLSSQAIENAAVAPQVPQPGGITPEQALYTGKELNASPVQQGVAGYTSSDLNSWWDKAMKAGKPVSKFLADNKELVNLAGGALKDMYGPQAEALDYQKSLMEQARRNINSPVVLQLRKA